MRKAMPAVLWTAAVLWCGLADAQPANAPAPKYKLQPLNLEKEQLGTTAMVHVGQARMSHGDCAGAVDAFDTVLHTAVDPSVNRDRGICHEKLGHPYPAIDDYRVYLTLQPDAPDAESIRKRLVQLEQTTTGRSSASTDEPGSAREGNPSPDEPMVPLKKQRDRMDSLDRDDDATERSALRRSTGWAVAPVLAVHKWFSSDSSFGAGDTWSECLGLQLRASLGKMGSLFLEGAYEHFNSTDVDPSTRSGLTALLAFELRFGLDPDYSNQLFVAPGVGYEHLAVVPSDPNFSSTTIGAVVPRLRLGYRHMLDAAVALDLALDLGVAKQFRYDSGSANLPTQELVGLSVGVDWGL